MIRRALVIGLLGLLVAGCTDGGCPPGDAYPAPGAQAPHVASVTTTGVALLTPRWLDMHPRGSEWRRLLLDEVATTEPEPDARIAPGTRGVPAGAVLVVLDPGPYWAPYSPTGRAAGEWRADTRTIYCAWRWPESGPCLPALPHEPRHVYTGDPGAGHK